MVHKGFLSFGGNEIVNNSRSKMYLDKAGCAASWIIGRPADGIADALGESRYNEDDTADAPWFDPDVPDLAARFYGVYALSIDGLDDSTTSAQMVESVTKGGRLGRSRKATRPVRVRAVLSARGQDALEYGKLWLDAVLDGHNCSQHGLVCGVGDAEFFAAAPPMRALPDSGQTDEEYQAEVNPLRRFLHGVGTTSGAIVTRTFNENGLFGCFVEFTLGAEDPSIYGVTRTIEVNPTVPYVVQDEAYNLVTHPSAALAGSTVAVATNYSQNPSVEVDASNWGYSAPSAPTRAAITGGRTTELAAEGVASYRARLLADGVTPTTSGLTAGVYVEHAIDLAGVPKNRFDARVWGAIIVAGGTAAITAMNAQVQWLNASNVQVGATIPLGGEVPAGNRGGYNFSASVAPAASDAPSITKAKIRIWFAFTYTASATPSLNADVRMYGDAAVFAIQ